MIEKINICFASDDNYAPYMGMALFSVLKNAGEEETFHFYVLDNKISEKNKQKIEKLKELYSFEITYLTLDEKIFKNCDLKRSNWTLSIFGRYLIPELISEDKVLYLDCDVFVRSSLLPLWKEDISEYYIGGVPDYNVILRGKLTKRFGKDFKPEEYVNSGVLLINNKKWREEHLFNTLLDYSVKNASLLQWPDQDAINVICQNRKKLLPERYNVMGFLYKPDLFLSHPRFNEIVEEPKHTVIRHFHPWEKNSFSPNREEYLSLMKVSPWADLMPKDDPYVLAWIKMIARYLWRHPFCFLLPKFYRYWKYRGTKCLFFDYR
ncbi:MAG: glycosyltransferase family 8 protein [Elusimicrobium sp.]|uniref:Glycosyltransferase family 8 protein n=1 Tax=Candidatus Avelusimicrobium gallicola TaxID=2562704 RepID=A0A928DNY1_9BACT|nr:glycosyltransferase family 8 protein [Elusimicrobium sp.]